MENFIYESFINDLTVCDKVIEFFKNSSHKNPGRIVNGVNTDIKESTDCALEGPLLQEYMDAIQKVANEYISKFPWCARYSSWGLTELPNIQHYAPGQGYHGWHTERASAKHPYSTRHLAFLTYLNDVTDQGGTEFEHQKIITTPAKGKTLIWPVDWTYTHRGIVSPSQEKYIVAGWYSFTE